MRKFNVNVNGKIYVVEIEETGEAAPIQEAPKNEAQPAPRSTVKASADSTQLKAPMSGTILDVKVKVGDAVKAGSVICILEAMKMENELVAPSDGVIESVVAKGTSVNTDDILASLK